MELCELRVTEFSGHGYLYINKNEQCFRRGQDVHFPLGLPFHGALKTLEVIYSILALNVQSGSSIYVRGMQFQAFCCINIAKGHWKPK